MEPTEEEIMMYLMQQGLLPQAAGPGFNRNGTAKDFTTGEQAKQLNFGQDWMSTLFNPQFAALAGGIGGQGGMDYSTLFPSQGAGFGQQQQAPTVLTPLLDGYRESTDPLEQQIMKMVDANASTGAINGAIRAAGLDEDSAKDYISDAKDLRAEQTKFAQAQADWAAKPVAQTPLEKMYTDAGFSSPTEMYTSENVTGLDRAGAETELEKLRQQLTNAQKKASETNQELRDKQAAVTATGAAKKKAATSAAAPAAAPLPGQPGWDPTSEPGNKNFLEAGWDAVWGASGAAGDAINNYLSDDPASTVNDGSSFLASAPAAINRRGTQANGAPRKQTKSESMKLQEELLRRSTQLENADAGVKNARAMHMRAAGKTPTGDQMTQRLLQMRAMGLA